MDGYRYKTEFMGGAYYWDQTNAKIILKKTIDRRDFTSRLSREQKHSHDVALASYFG